MVFPEHIDGGVRPIVAATRPSEAGMHDWNHIACASVAITRRGPSDMPFLRRAWKNESFMQDFHPHAPALPVEDARLAQTLERERSSSFDQCTHVHWTIRTPRMDPVGMVSLLDISPLHRRAELLLGVIDVGAFGLSTGALLLALEFAFEFRRLHKVYSFVSATNPRSLKSTLHAGFSVEGTLRDHWYDRRTGSFMTVHQTAIFAADALSERNQRLRKRLLGPPAPG